MCMIASDLSIRAMSLKRFSHSFDDSVSGENHEGIVVFLAAVSLANIIFLYANLVLPLRTESSLTKNRETLQNHQAGRDRKITGELQIHNLKGSIQEKNVIQCHQYKLTIHCQNWRYFCLHLLFSH